MIRRLKVSPWIFQFISVWLVVYLCAYLCLNFSFWFYPLAILFIGNRYFALTLLGHEAAHGLLAKNAGLNTFIGRWLCHFPCLTSHTHYQGLHLRHHNLLGTEQDLDRPLYEPDLPEFTVFFKIKVLELLTGKMLLNFIRYFNGLPFYLKARKIKPLPNDYLAFTLFWITTLTFIITAGNWIHFLLFWILPALLWLPWMQFVNYFHHHFSDKSEAKTEFYSRDIKLNPILQTLLFSINLHLHRTHHLAPHLSYDQLPMLAKPTESSDFFDLIKNELFTKKVIQS